MGNLNPPTVEISPGVIWKPLPNVVAYEATIPINYKMEFFQEDVAQQRPKMDSVCVNKATTDCYLEVAIQKLSAAYEVDLQILKRNLKNNILTDKEEEQHIPKRKERALDFIGSAFNWCCDVATMHNLDSITTNEHELEEQIRKLTEGLSETIKGIGKDSNEFKNYEAEVTVAFETMEKRMHLVENEIATSRKNDADEVRVITRLYTHMYENLRRIISLTRVIRTNSIINSCKQHQIPSNILEITTLRHDLVRLEKELETDNQRLAISASEVSRYYQLPICACTFTESKIFLHLKIPIISLNQNWKLFELVTNSFAWYNQTCSLNHDTLYVAVSKNARGKQTIRTVTGVALHQCRVYEDKLCYVPQLSTDDLHGPLCAIKMFNGDTVENLSKYCSMTCYSSTAMLILEVAEEEYLITHPKPETRIECQNNSRLLVNGRVENLGALRLYLPCSCKLIILNDILINTRYPCQKILPSEAEINQISQQRGRP